METMNKSISLVGIHDTMGDTAKKLDRIIAVLDQMNEDFFETRHQPSMQAIATMVNKPAGAKTSEEEHFSYDWVVSYSRIQNFIGIIEDYVRDSKDVLSLKMDEFYTDNEVS